MIHSLLEQELPVESHCGLTVKCLLLLLLFYTVVELLGGGTLLEVGQQGKHLGVLLGQPTSGRLCLYSAICREVGGPKYTFLPLWGYCHHAIDFVINCTHSNCEPMRTHTSLSRCLSGIWSQQQIKVTNRLALIRTM